MLQLPYSSRGPKIRPQNPRIQLKEHLETDPRNSRIITSFAKLVTDKCV
jgi:ribosomal protein S30